MSPARVLGPENWRVSGSDGDVSECGPRMSWSMTFELRLIKRLQALLQEVLAAVRHHSHVNWALADQAMVSACNFLTMVLLARYLGVQEFGRFTLAWMVVLISINLHATLVISPMMSIGPKQRAGDRPGYFGALMLQQLVVVVIATVLILGGALASDSLFPSWHAGQLALPLACAAVAYNAQEFLRRYFFSIGSVVHAFTTDAIRYPGQIVAFVALSQLTELDVNTALWIIFASAMLGLVPFIRHFERMRWDRKFFRAAIVRHWNFSKWLTVGSIMSMASANLLFIAAGAFLGASAVGALNAARTLLGVTNIVFFGLDNIVPAQAARRFHEAGIGALNQYLGRLTILVGALTSSIVIVAAVMPEFWLRLAFGPEYSGFGYLVQWWAVVILVYAPNVPLRAGLLAIERTKAIFFASLFSTLFVCASAYSLVTQFELIGVVVGMIAMNLCRNGLLANSFFRQLPQLRSTEGTQPESH